MNTDTNNTPVINLDPAEHKDCVCCDGHPDDDGFFINEVGDWEPCAICGGWGWRD